MTEHTLLLSLAALEGTHLAHLVDELLVVLLDAESENDPAVQRLAPQAYPEDAEASAEFSRATRSDLLSRRVQDAETVRSALQAFSTEEREFTQEDAVAETGVPIPASDLDSWMRTLNTLRLVIAERLGIHTDDDHHVGDPQFGVYDWLGYRLEVLIEMADQLDGDAS